MSSNIKAAQNYFTNFISKGNKRSLAAKKNILWLFLIKGINLLISLMVIPITIGYVEPNRYGIWLTLTSIISWFTILDIGFGNGLRNKFAEAKALGNYTDARIFVSTTYAILIIIFTGLWSIFFVTNFYVDWALILNAPSNLSSELSTVALIVFSFFCLQMMFKTITTIIIADQKPALSGFVDMVGPLIALALIYILTKTTEGSLINLGIAIGFPSIIIFVLASFYFFNHSYKFVAPSWRYVKFKRANEIMRLGIKFFIIQISMVIIFQTNNIIIAQVEAPVNVTYFNIAFKYLTIPLILFSIILNPFWSAITEAYVKRDYQWISSVVRKLRKISVYAALSIIPFVILSPYVYRFWIGELVLVPFSVTVTVAFYVFFQIFSSLNTQILNGFGKIKFQLILFVFGAVLHIPTAIFLSKYFGANGVIISSGIYYAIIATISFKQVNLLVKQKAEHIWNS